VWIPHNQRQQDDPDRDQQHSQSSLVALAPFLADERQNAQQNEEQRDQHLQIDTEANAGVPSDLLHCGLGIQRQTQRGLAAAQVFTILERKRPAVRLGDLAAQNQTNTASSGLRREEGHE